MKNAPDNRSFYSRLKLEGSREANDERAVSLADHLQIGIFPKIRKLPT